MKMKKCKRNTRQFVLLFLSVSLFAATLPIMASQTKVNKANSIDGLQQDRMTVKGIVHDELGEPLIGVSVSYKQNGEQIGTITDVDGKFSISNVAKGSLITFSYVGFNTHQVTADGSEINLVMTTSQDFLDEVVIVGYGTQKKVNVTGAVSSIDSKALASRPVQNVSQALQGVIPGLNFTVGSGGGEMDKAMSVSIRGRGNLGDGSTSSPLILIDGVEGNMNALNPLDIENVTVLKDAASSAIYGARAAFGVIMITTKTGKSGRTSVNYSGNVRFTDALAIPKMLDSYRFAQYFNEGAKNDGQSAVFSPDAMQRILDYRNGIFKDGTVAHPTNNRWENYGGANANTNWFDEMYNDWVPSHEHSLNVSGGTEKMTYFVSGNFLDQKGLIKHGSDNFNRYSLNGKINATLSKHIKLNYNSRWIREDYDRPTYMTGLFFHNIARRWPTNPVYDPNGFYTEGNEIQQMEDGGIQTSQKDYLYQNVQVIIEPLKDWNIYLEGHYNTVNQFQHWEVLPIYAHDTKGVPYLFSWDGRTAGSSSVYEYGYKENQMSTNLFSDYSKQFDSGHYFKIMGGFNAELFKTRNLSGTKDGLISADVPTLNTSTTNARTAGGYGHWSTAGFFGRVNYNYKERYLAEANVRHDGASRFVGNKLWGTFPSFSAGWNIAREGFFEDYTQQISTLKLRASWGQLGNMRSNDFGWHPSYLTMPASSDTGAWLIDGKRTNLASAPGIVSDRMTWEKVQSWDIGLDWAALNNRLTGMVDYFKRTTKDMIGPAPELGAALGTAVPRENNADMESYGFELEIGWRDHIGDFSYGARFVLADAQSKVTRYPNDGNSLSRWYNGQKDGEIWGYKTIGIAKSQEEMDAHLAKVDQSSLGSKWGAGDIMYADLDGSKRIDKGENSLSNSGDITVIGNNIPRYQYGITLDAAWKGIDFRVFFQGIGKRDYMLGGPYFWGANGGMWQSAAFEEHWNFFRPEGHELGANLDSYYPRPIFDSGGKNQQTQSKYIQNASYFRMKNIQLGYTLPMNLTQKAKIQSVRFYVSGDNLLTISDISGVFDPETIGGSYGDGKLYPLSKVISVGVNINF